MGRKKETKALTRRSYINRELVEAMTRMSGDSDIRRECKVIGREFARAERDGLK